MNQKQVNMVEYFSGKKLWGDDFDPEEIRLWYEQEENAYPKLLESYDYEYEYIYNTINCQLGYKYVDFSSVENALGFGAMTGQEIIPIAKNLKSITLVEQGLTSVKPINNIKPIIVKPKVDGKLKFKDESYDLVTCFGVLHHCPNVSFILNELIRVISRGGYLVLRESISSMGDWRFKRKLCTPNERGIPVHIFDNVFREKNCEIVSKKYCDSLWALKIIKKFYNLDYDTKAFIYIDSILSKILRWNVVYHRVNLFRKLAPGSIAYVVKKS